MKHSIIGTAGHVDHGKTALVKALTGTDCDRLKEEKERGLTIELGYASLDLGDGKSVSIVDVPGHERFVKTMLAGAAVIDCVLFVIAADEGVMPQTIEHFDIINILQVKDGLIVLTKVDLVDEEWLELVNEDIAELVEGTVLENAPVVPVSSITGEGIPELKAHIANIVEKLEPKSQEGIFRFPVDWTFNVSGIGTVVCGAAFSGRGKVGDILEITPQQKEVRIRGIQLHGEDVEEAVAGQQVAINISGIDRGEIKRGDVLSLPDYLRPTYMLDARLHLLENSPVVLKNRDRINLYLACSEVIGRVVILNKERLTPGEDALIQFRLEEQLVAEHGDRFVIRRYSPPHTIGGGIILNPFPAKHKRFRQDIIEHLNIMNEGTPEERVEATLLKSGTHPNTAEDLVRRLNITPSGVKSTLEQLVSARCVFAFDDQFVHIDWYNKSKDSLLEILGKYHAQQPLKFGISREELRTKLPEKTELPLYSEILQTLIDEGRVVGEGEKVRLPGHSIKISEEHENIKRQIEELFLKAGLATPLPEDALSRWQGRKAQIAREAFDVLVETNTLVQADEKVLFHKDVIDKAKNLVVQHIREHAKLTLDDCRNLLGTSRKYMLPLLYYFDNAGVTLRVGNDRILRVHNSVALDLSNG